MINALEEPQAEDLAGGWEGLDALDKRLSKPAEPEPDEYRRMAQVALTVFSTDEGRQVLDWMLAQTVRRASVPNFDLEGLLVDPKQLVAYVLWAEAQKAFVLRLVALIEAGKGGRNTRAPTIRRSRDEKKTVDAQVDLGAGRRGRKRR